MIPVRRPGTAQSYVTEFEGSGRINPNPVTAQGSDLLFDHYLSSAKLVRPKPHNSGDATIYIASICKD